MEVAKENQRLCDLANMNEQQRVDHELHDRKYRIAVPNIRLTRKTNPLRYDGWKLVRDSLCQTAITYVRSGGHRNLGDFTVQLSPEHALSADGRSFLLARLL